MDKLLNKYKKVNTRLVAGKTCYYKEETNEIVVEITKEDFAFYFIDLDRCTNAEELLDWVYQVMGKTWCTPKIIYDVLELFDSLCRLKLNNSAQGWLRKPSIIRGFINE